MPPQTAVAPDLCHRCLAKRGNSIEQGLRKPEPFDNAEVLVNCRGQSLYWRATKRRAKPGALFNYPITELVQTGRTFWAS
ncbi:MAG: hypothetical protein ACI9BK_003298 [Acidimicrobiales bacterium]|jgi:hypothetical protein